MKYKGRTSFSIGRLSRWDETEQSIFESTFGVRGMEPWREDAPGEGGGQMGASGLWIPPTLF